MRVRSTKQFGALLVIGAGGAPWRSALAWVLAAAVAVALVPGRPYGADAPTGPEEATLEADAGHPDEHAVPEGERTDAPLSDESEDERDDDRDEDRDGLVLLAWNAPHDWTPLGLRVIVDALHTHAPPDQAHTTALERPPRAV